MSEIRKDFAVFILSHGRADNVITWGTLDRCGYTGRRYVVVDNEDDQEEQYRKRFGKAVLVIDKREIEKQFDTFDNRDERRTVVFARNACFDLARQVGVKYFLELDDDYTEFLSRWVKDRRLMSARITDFDGLCEAMIDFLETSGAKTVCFAQGGDFIGGANNPRFQRGLMRKAMNSFFCSVERPFQFLGRVNEDVNTYTTLGSRGDLFLTVCRLMLTQKQTQANSGGMTDVYIDGGTYTKTFYTVMCMPSAVTVSIMGQSHLRMHHKIRWENCVPQILSERWRRWRS